MLILLHESAPPNIIMELSVTWPGASPVSAQRTVNGVVLTVDGAESVEGITELLQSVR
jgi:hypothetical protein